MANTTPDKNGDVLSVGQRVTLDGKGSVQYTISAIHKTSLNLTSGDPKVNSTADGSTATLVPGS